MAVIKKLNIHKPISGGLLLSYKCSGTCKHCMYSCSPSWSADWINEDDITCYLSQLSAMIKPSPYGRNNVDLNSGLHFTGGEPFLNFELLLKATKIANELNIPSSFVETNCFWCKNDDATEHKLQQLKDAGINGIMISVNPFILEYVPFEKTARAVRISRKVFGQNAFIYQSFFYHQFQDFGIEDTLSLEDYIKRVGLGCFDITEMIPMGRFPYRLGYLFRRNKAESFFGQSCRVRLTSPYHIHVDNYGNYMGGFCGGISLGDAHDLELIFDGIDLGKRPVLKALVTTGVEELYELGKEFGYKQLAEGYVSACHLCMDIRKHLVQRTDEFVELRPQELYSRI